ncbi:MAG: hydrogen gas-evolving membrane-bound hydrogenase subunit E [Candidatus Aegiribacteria sp.]
MRTIAGLVIVLLLGIFIVNAVPGVQVPERLTGAGREYAERGLEDTGSANLVTAVIVSYRGLDTLGEVVVLFCASTAVVLILSLFPIGGRATEPSAVVAETSRVLPAPIMLFAFYFITHSHISPGGGFPGGTVVASAFLLVMLGSSSVPAGSGRLSAVESMAGLSFGLLGFWGVMRAGQFLNTAVLGGGEPGELLSAGIVPLVSLAIGAKVAAEFSGVFAAFRRAGTDR